MPTVLVVDDRREARQLIAEELAQAGFRVVAAADGVEGWRRFRSAMPDLVITDLRMPRADGIELLRRVRADSTTPVILLTAYADVSAAVVAMKSGATDFLEFPDQLATAVDRAQEVLASGRCAPGAARVEVLFPGRSRAIRRVRRRIVALATLRVPVLVSGEPGSGRDTAVLGLHRLAEGAEQPLVVLRPEDPAAADPWSAALGEPVYLDEVHRHPAEAQRRWARRLREAEEGATRPGFRLYASACVDLAARARAGRFSGELAARLGRFSVTLPPLRDRTEDLSELVARLVERVASAVGRRGVRVSSSGLARLREHAWPGNLRELVSVVERMVTFSSRGTLDGRVAQEALGESVETLHSLRAGRTRRERDELVALLRDCGGNLAEVARRLGMSRGAVHYRVRKHGLVASARWGSRRRGRPAPEESDAGTDEGCGRTGSPR